MRNFFAHVLYEKNVGPKLGARGSGGIGVDVRLRLVDTLDRQGLVITGLYFVEDYSLSEPGLERA